MINLISPTYRRAPVTALKDLLSPGGLLAPLLELTARRVSGLGLDIHLRGSEIHVYCGLTRILTAGVNTDGTVKVSAHFTYESHDCARGITGPWDTGDVRKFRLALDAYLQGVKVAERHTGHEGWVQSHWSRVSGPRTHFDREAVLGCVSPEGPNRARDYDYVLAALAELAGRNDWSRRLPRAGGGRSEVDQLAVDTEGRLVLIELKSTSGGADGIYCSPLQVLGYLCEWHAAPGAVLGDAQALIDARIELGLTVGPAPRLSGGLLGVIGFGRDTRSCIDWWWN